ncbi:hypothetical protein [Crateriforma spongiae]|uniref:hypothetical protein n=1 Tax=Crateriforma spongiae TaxID=2724528 RepID=UPI001446ED59|nr:hypothetical protein [Crateriforma spongiae]
MFLSLIFRRTPSLACVALLVSLAGSVTEAAVFDSFDPDRHVRFATGAISVGSELPVNSGFLIDHNQISGVGINSVALITPQHYVTADHAATGVAQFRGSDGIVRQYASNGFTTIARGGNNTDIRIYTLAYPIPTAHGVKPLSIATAPFAPDWMDRNLYVFGKRNVEGTSMQVAGVNDVSVVASNVELNTGQITNSIEFAFERGTSSDEIGLQGGDSGSTTLTWAGGQLVLAGLNSGIQTGVSPTDTSGVYLNYVTYLGGYVNEINDYVGQTEYQGQALSISTISVTAVPEPGTLLACGVIAGVGVVRNYRRKSNKRKSIA